MTGNGSAALGVHLVGHSFGGLVVRESVLAGATGITSLTFMSSGPGRLTGPAAVELAQLTRSLDSGSPEVMRRTIRRIWHTNLAPQAATAGIAPEIEGRLFQPFVTSKPGGMGIGLLISKRIIEAHGGEINFRKGQGGGAVFHFTLMSGEARRDAG